MESKRNYWRFLGCMVSIILIASCATHDKPTATRLTRVLFIGNSYTMYNNLPELFHQLAESGNKRVEVDMAAAGSKTLKDHVARAETRDKLNRRWDYVVLQEQSVTPAVRNLRQQNMIPAVRTLAEAIRQQGGQPVLFLTWGRKNGFRKRFSDFNEMQLALNEGYAEVARLIDGIVAPVGPAWAKALQLKPDLSLWDADNNHPDDPGSYLAACVFYAVVFRESPAGLPYIANLEPQVAALLQRVANETVLAGTGGQPPVALLQATKGLQGRPAQYRTSTR